MELTKEMRNCLIESLRRCDFKPQEIHNVLKTAWPNDSLCLQQVSKLCKEFREGDRNSFTRKNGSGRSKSERRDQSVEQVRAIIEQDNCLSYRSIAAQLDDVSESMVYRILTEDLEKRWVLTKWVPHTLSNENKVVRIQRCGDLIESLSSRLTQSNLVVIDENFFYCRKIQPSYKIESWIGPGGDVRRQTARRSSMEKKFLAIIAVSSKGKHFFEVLPRNESIDANRYIQFLINMENYFSALSEPILTHNMRLQHDNANPHTAKATTNHLEERNIRILRQPPYSPDTNLCDS